jgi:hypothetical protein
MKFYKIKYNNSYEIINLNLIRLIWYSGEEFDTNYRNDDSIITVHIKFINETVLTYDFSYQELLSFERALNSSIS